MLDDKPNIKKLFLKTKLKNTFEERMYINENTGERVKAGIKSPVFHPVKTLLNKACIACDSPRWLISRGRRGGRIDIIKCACTCTIEVY